MTRDVVSRIAVAVTCVLCLAATAAAAPQAPAQGPAQAPEAQQGPLVLQPIESGLFLMPEIRLSRVDKYSATFFGGSGGWVFRDVFVLGAGGYAMVSGKDNVGMRYGGLVAGVQLPAGESMKIGLRALFGFGNAQLVSYFPCPYPTAGFAPCYEPVGIDVGFSVFEPQASIVVRLGQKWTLDVSGGYRVVGDADGLEGRLQSGFGGIGLRFGSF